jgi:hypothetical protein
MKEFEEQQAADEGKAAATSAPGGRREEGGKYQSLDCRGYCPLGSESFSLLRLYRRCTECDLGGRGNVEESRTKRYLTIPIVGGSIGGAMLLECR